MTPSLHMRAVLASLVLALFACGDEAVAPPGDPTVAPSFHRYGHGAEDVNQVFTVTTAADDGAGSLRQAILDANGSPGRDAIWFSIPGPGPHIVQLSSPLPLLTDAVVIDGYTQPGARANEKPTRLGSNAVIEVGLDGTTAGPFVPGLIVLGGGSTVRGLALSGFQDAIVLVSAGNRVHGNYIGTDVSGTAAAPNFASGVLILDADNVVGGSTPRDRNVISGNLGDGVQIAGPGAMGNVVAGNYIGVDASGNAPLPNGVPEPDPANSAGVHIRDGASENLVGGPRHGPDACTGPCNVIAGNHRSGVWLAAFAHHNTIEGNLIGVSADGEVPLGHARWGVFIGRAQEGPPANDNVIAGNRIEWSGRDGIGLIGGSSGNVIGGEGAQPGTCSGPCNRIAFSGQNPAIGGDGIRIYHNLPLTGMRNSFLGNSISENPRGQAIDIFPNGPTPNDPGDFDFGENGIQNTPEIAAAVVTRGHLVVEGTIDTPDPERVVIEIYGNPVPAPGPDESGFGEAAVFLGRATPGADGSFRAELHVVAPGMLISATATDAEGNTSELSRNVEAVRDAGSE